MVAAADAPTTGCRKGLCFQPRPSKEHTMERARLIDQVLEAAEIPQTDEDHQVLEWQLERLEQLGVSRIKAALFAGRVDWHEIAALVSRGCSPELALEIVR
jgi:hypothetical protein